MATAFFIVAIEIAVLLILVIARHAWRAWLERACTFFISLAAACSLALAVQSVLMHRMGLIVGWEPWSALLWLVLGLIGFAIAISLKSSASSIAGACWLVAAASLTYSIFSHETLGLLTACAMAAVGLCSWWCSRLPRNFAGTGYRVALKVPTPVLEQATEMQCAFEPRGAEQSFMVQAERRP